jgi:hypothetical protein
MKKFISLTLIALAFSARAFADTPPAVASPSVGPYQYANPATNGSNETWYHWQITLRQIKALGANASGDIALFITSKSPANTPSPTTGIPSMITGVIMGVTTNVAGSGTVQALVKTGNSYGSAQTVSGALANTNVYPTSLPLTYIEAGGTTVNLHLTSSTNHFDTATAGAFDVWVKRVELR